ncbi:MAG: ATP-binding protein [Proteobacteria bacterium]|nr:ATP-binding protein [Pseudomonadota bacterium]
MPTEIALLGFLALVLTAAFGWLLRIERDEALRYWAWGWGAFLASSCLAAAVLVGGLDPERAWYRGVTFGLGTALPYLLSAGALAYANHSLPSWYFRLAFCACAARAGAAMLGERDLALTLSLPLEVPPYVVAAFALWRSLPRALDKGLVRALALSYGGFAVIEGAAATTWLLRTDDRWILFGAAGLTLVGAGIQLLAVLTRIRERERQAQAARERDLRLLRDVARASGAHTRREALAREVLPLVAVALEARGSALWLLDKTEQRFRRAAAWGHSETRGLSFQSFSAHSELGEILLAGRELFQDDLETDERAIPSRARSGGFGAGALLPLQARGRVVGALAVGMRARNALGEDSRALLRTVADEVALALERVRTLEEHTEDQTALRSERRTLRAVLETSPVGVLLEDRDRRTAMINNIGADHLDLDDPERFIGQPLAELLDWVVPRLEGGQETADQLKSMDRRDRIVADFDVVLTEPYERRLKVFTSPVLSPDGRSLGRVWCTRDVTEEQRLEAELRQSQKLDTLGRLAGGIAHDFNNQLTAILGNARLALDATAKDDSLRGALEDLERAASHCAALTRSLLAFSRRTPKRTRALAVPTLLAEVRDLLRPLIPSSIAFEVAWDEDVPPIEADPTQVQQILVNLVVNARDATPEGGSVTVKARKHSPADDGAGDFVEFEVADSGCGMEPKDLQRIFEPFFTTKEVGGGTGLGLAIAYGLVSAHQGRIDVDSEPGRGTTFRVLLPATTARGDESPDAVPPCPRGHECILVADDEPALRRLARRALESAGYRVLEARDGEAALRRFKDHSDEIAAVILDVTMPGRSGLGVLRELKAARPQLPALLVSGHPDAESEAAAIPAVRFLPKPYDALTLCSTVRALLDQTEPLSPDSPSE